MDTLKKLLLVGLLCLTTSVSADWKKRKTVTWEPVSAPCVRVYIGASRTKLYSLARYCDGRTSVRVPVISGGTTVSVAACDKRGRNCKICDNSSVVVK